MTCPNCKSTDFTSDQPTQHGITEGLRVLSDSEVQALITSAKITEISCTHCGRIVEVGTPKKRKWWNF